MERDKENFDGWMIDYEALNFILLNCNMSTY